MLRAERPIDDIAARGFLRLLRHLRLSISSRQRALASAGAKPFHLAPPALQSPRLISSGSAAPYVARRTYNMPLNQA